MNEATTFRADGQHATPPSPDAGGTPPSPAEGTSSVTIDVSRLILGRAIRFPLHDKSGLLLLREGSVITTEFKKKLETRNIGTVSVHRDDAQTVAFDRPADAPRTAAYDSAVSRKLDAALTEGLPFVTNQGPAVRASVVYHGRKAYDPETRKQLEEENRRTSEAMRTLMDAARHGAEVDGRRVADTASGYLKHLVSDMDQALSLPIDAGVDDALSRHCLQMSLLGMAIAVELGLNEENVGRVGVTGLVHDWGMIRVPAEIRMAERRLTETEMLEIRKHPIHALDILEGVVGLPSLVPFLSYQVHEKLDGSGYPRGRVERNIHLFARILHVADIFAALTSPRPWRPAYAPYAAMKSLLSTDNQHGCDPLVIRALLRVKSLFPVGSYVTLSDASVAQVIRANGDRYTQPIVQVVEDAKGRSLIDVKEPVLVDLTDSPLRVAEALPTPGRQELTTAPAFTRQRIKAAERAHVDVKRPHLNLGPANSGLNTASNMATAENHDGVQPPHDAAPRPHIRANGRRRTVVRLGD